MKPQIPDHGKLLIRIPNWIGDAVMCTAGLAALHENRPDLQITALLKPWVSDVLKHHPAISNIIRYHPRRFPARFVDFARIVSDIRTQSFSGCLLFQKNFESALIGYAAGIPIRIGQPTDRRRMLLTHPIDLPDADFRGHQVLMYRAIAEYMTGVPSSDECVPQVFLSDFDRHQAKEYQALLLPGGPLIPVSAGAAYGSAKCWPPEKFAEFVDRVVSRWNARVVFLGSSADASVFERIMTLCKYPAQCMAGKYSLLTQAALIELAGICVANDSGLMHVSAALQGVRTVAIFGPTKPVETGPFGGQHIILHKQVSCWPCRYRHCPLDHACMQAISVDDVMNAVETVIGKR